MRPITPLTLSDVAPADLSRQPQPDFDLVDPRDLLVDDAYQRDLSPKSTALIRRIVEGFRWSKFKPPICVRVDGKLHVLDGQHTSIACASHPGVSVIPVIVVDEPAIVDRARAFVSHARDRLSATPGQLWHAEVAAGDEDAVTVQRVCERAGVKLLRFAPPSSVYAPGETVALASIKGLVKRRGAMRAREVLEALAKADLAPIPGDMIKAAESLMCDDAFKDEMDVERLTASIRALGPRAMEEAKGLAAAKKLPLWRALSATIFKHKVKSKGPAKAIGVPAPAAAPQVGPAVTALLSIHRSAARPPEPAAYNPGDPPPGRSALDQRVRA